MTTLGTLLTRRQAITLLSYAMIAVRICINNPCGKEGLS
jgi:hypothetical protein